MLEANLHISSINTLPAVVKNEWINSLTEEEALAYLYNWEFWARPEQLIPQGNWRYWFLMAGRGFGKTRTGAETVRQWVKHFPIVNLIGATADDARDIMIEGESGILAICHPDERPRYLTSKRRLEWPNGARSLIFTADEPERLRGKQHMKLWADEIASWRYLKQSWDQAMFGLRLGNDPQAVITSTPKPLPSILELLDHPKMILTTGTTYDNKENLAEGFYEDIITKYEGTRLGRQELLAEILGDVPGALWTRDIIEKYRVDEAPELYRVVVAIDPAVTNEEGSNKTGIIVAGMAKRGSLYHGYTLEDLSIQGSPDEWARRAVQAYYDYGADRIIAESNQGGDMIEHTIRTVDSNVSFKKVHASKGKHTRAEPIGAVFEQGRGHHVGAFPELEDQMCTWIPGDDSPDNLDAMVWAYTELLLEAPTQGVTVRTKGLRNRPGVGGRSRGRGR